MRINESAKGASRKPVQASAGRRGVLNGESVSLGSETCRGNVTGAETLSADAGPSGLHVLTLIEYRE